MDQSMYSRFSKHIENIIKQTVADVKRSYKIKLIFATYLLLHTALDKPLLNLEKEKECKILDLDTCDATNVSFIYQDDFEGIANKYVAPTLESLVILTCCYLSDKWNIRKPFLLMALFGQLAISANGLLSSAFMKGIPLGLQSVMFIASSFLGPRKLMYIMTLAYTIDISTIRYRFSNVLLLFLIETMVTFFDYLVGLTDAVRHHYVVGFLITACLESLLIMYVMSQLEEETSLEDIEWRSAFNYKQVLEELNSFLTRRNLKAIIYIFVATGFNTIMTLVNKGEYVLHWKYIHDRFKIQASLDTYLFFAKIFFLVSMNVVGLVCPLNDAAVLLFACAQKVAGEIVLAYAYEYVYLFYYGGYFYTIATLELPALTSFSTKIISQNDAAKSLYVLVFSDIVLIFSKPPFIDSYVEFYEKSERCIVGIYLYIGVIIYLVLLSGAMCLYYTNLKRTKKTKKGRKSNVSGDIFKTKKKLLDNPDNNYVQPVSYM